MATLKCKDITEPKPSEVKAMLKKIETHTGYKLSLRSSSMWVTITHTTEEFTIHACDMHGLGFSMLIDIDHIKYGKYDADFFGKSFDLASVDYDGYDHIIFTTAEE